MEEKKLCPYCGKEILKVAKKCKHCGEWLDGAKHIDTHIESQHMHNERKAGGTWKVGFFLIFAIVIVLCLVVVVNHNNVKSDVLTEQSDPVINFADSEERSGETTYINNNCESENDATDTKETEDVLFEDPNTEELLRMGENYEKGFDVEVDYEKAFYYYEKAAKAGDPMALNKLGNMYAKGNGCTKDVYKAAAYYLKAAKKGNKYAQHNIAFCYWDGNGVEKNHEKAIMWMRLSAEQGYDDAIKALIIFGDN